MPPTIQQDQTLAIRSDEVESTSAEPLGGLVASIIISFISISALSVFLYTKILNITHWKRMPFNSWIVLMIYIDSYFFVLVTAVLQFGPGINTDHNICDGAILLCLICYITTKILIYLFLVERAYVIRNTMKPRFKSKLYLFNSVGMLGVYIAIAILNFIFRITRLQDNLCIIGMEKKSMIPLITFDFVVNVYLTLLFLVPLIRMYSFKNAGMTYHDPLRQLALRTTIGAICTLISSIVNLTILMVLEGEPGWVCLLCCNSDILFSAIVIQWLTSPDNSKFIETHRGRQARRNAEANVPPITTPNGGSDRGEGHGSPQDTGMPVSPTRSLGNGVLKAKITFTDPFSQANTSHQHNPQSRIQSN